MISWLVEELYAAIGLGVYINITALLKFVPLDTDWVYLTRLTEDRFDTYQFQPSVIGKT